MMAPDLPSSCLCHSRNAGFPNLEVNQFRVRQSCGSVTVVANKTYPTGTTYRADFASPGGNLSTQSTICSRDPCKLAILGVKPSKGFAGS